MLFLKVDDSNFSPKISQCTGFLIADDIVVTNSHCIPNRFKTSKLSCNSQIAIRFMSSSNSKNIFSCKEIISFSSKDTSGQDYAFIRVEKTGRTPFKIHKTGLKDNEPIRVSKITPYSLTVGGKIETVACRVAFDTLLNFKGINAWYMTGIGIGCDAFNGNSGSPVINDAGEVIGILQGKVLDKYRELLIAAFKPIKLEFPATIPRHMKFTSLSCVADPITGYFDEPKCTESEKLSFSDLIKIDEITTETNSKRLYENWKAELPTIFVFEFITEIQN